MNRDKLKIIHIVCLNFWLTAQGIHRERFKCIVAAYFVLTVFQCQVGDAAQVSPTHSEDGRLHICISKDCTYIVKISKKYTR